MDRPRLPAGLVRWGREPLVQFLVIGAVLFGGYALTHKQGPGFGGETIVISEGRIKQIAEGYLLLAGRLPSRDEMQTLVDDFVTEEINYREAVAMGLDADDTIVRRRMRQKLEFLVEDAGASRDPTEAELKDWVEKRPETYHLPERRAIRQVLASSDRRGAKAETDAGAMLMKLTAGEDPAQIGDASMLPAVTPLSTQDGIAAQFGDDFAKAVFTAKAGGWIGPVASPYGRHLVQIMQVEQGRPLSLDEVRDKAKSDWIEVRRTQARDDAQAKLRQRYKVTIDWPKPFEDLPSTPDANPKTKRSVFGVDE